VAGQERDALARPLLSRYVPGMAAREIQDMVVVITGASAGIGRALAEALAGQGARLSLSARRLDRLSELNQQLGGRNLVLRADVAIESDCRLLIEKTIEHFGRIDTLVCNAGYGLARPVAEATAAELQAIFQTNVFGTTDCIRYAVPHMRQQGPQAGWRGQILIVSSAMARRTVPNFGAYGATKAAQLSLAEAMRVELAPEAIAVTSVHPVGTKTEFFDQVEAQSGRRLEPATTRMVRQSAQAVARAMVRGIRRPRPEVWPMRTARPLMSSVTFFPRIADWVLSRYRDRAGGH
jgi:short-subunit dehydrogenase